jgi:hypothetical protein
VPRTQSLIVAVSLGLAVVFGVIALNKTVHLGQAAAAKPVAKSLIAKRTAQLNRFEASLRAQLRKKPPAVPKVPKTPIATPTASAPAAAPAAPAAPAAAPAPAASQRVVYVRPAPIIVHKHRAGGGESEGSDHGDNGGDNGGAGGGGGGND